jgi:hypothetical protein
MVTGSDKPLITKRELLEFAAVTVTFAPLAVRLPVDDPLVPATTLPIAMGEGDAVSDPTVAVPAPVRGIVKLGLDAVEVMVTLPLVLAADVGANLTLNVVL